MLGTTTYIAPFIDFIDTQQQADRKALVSDLVRILGGQKLQKKLGRFVSTDLAYVILLMNSKKRCKFSVSWVHQAATGPLDRTVCTLITILPIS